MILVLIASDVVSLAISGLIALLPKWSIGGFQFALSYAFLIPFLSLFVLVFWALGFYSGVSLSSPEELRRSSLACLSVSLCVAATTVFLRQSHVLFTWAMLPAVVAAMIAVPVAREFVRYRFSRESWWGYPTVVFGDEASAKQLIRVLHKNVDLGLKPVAFICTGPDHVRHVYGIPVIEASELPAWEPCLRQSGYALLTGTSQFRGRLMDIVADNRACFPHVLIIPEAWEFSSYWVRPKNLGGFLGLEVKEHIFQPSKRLLKRIFDLVLASIVALAGLPLFVIISILIRLDSGGPVFYSQRRIGRGGREFRAWKFRSMLPNADALLHAYLSEHPEKALEWKQNHKLRLDPRVTKVGRFLRQTSLDEIPQLWNVLRGEMSLVGPRPIVRAEIAKYGKYFELYTRVQSGVTGLWQVSGRSETTYEDRVAMDTFYVRNWSVWLDLCILFRTIGVLCMRTGAY